LTKIIIFMLDTTHSHTETCAKIIICKEVAACFPTSQCIDMVQKTFWKIRWELKRSMSC